MEMSEENVYCSLFDIPTEIFLQICLFLDPSSLKNLDLVCKKFHSILEDNSIWRSRLRKRWCNNLSVYPPTSVNDRIEENYDWRGACMDIEYSFELFQKPDINWTHFRFDRIHLGEVNTVVLYEQGTRCVSASRDHTMISWDLSKEVIDWTIHNKMHNGWIWNLAVNEEHKKMYSCSFDRTVKTWNLDTFENITTAVFAIPPLSLAYSSGIVAVGLLNGKVALIDNRVQAPFTKFSLHKRPILDMTFLNYNHLGTISEDETYAVFDIRAGKSIKNVTYLHGEDRIPRIGKTPLCISYNEDMIYIGDSGGLLHLINAKAYGDYERVGVYDIGHKDRLTSVHHNRGRLITCSNDYTVRFFVPTNKPVHLLTIHSTNKLNKLFYQNRTLALAGCESAVEFWRHNSLYHQ